MRKARGAAILIAMLVVSLLGVVGFGLARVIIKQIRIQGSLTATTKAYEAAEAGLEYGLLQYKLDRTYDFSESANVPTDIGNYHFTGVASFSLPGTDQTAEVRMSQRPLQIGSQACFIDTTLTTPDAFKNCDGQNGRTLGLIWPGQSMEFIKDPGNKFLLRLMPTGGLPALSSDPNAEQGQVVIDAYDGAGGFMGQSNFLLTGGARNMVTVDSGNALLDVSSPSGMQASGARVVVRYFCGAGAVGDCGSQPAYVAVETVDDNGFYKPFTTTRTMLDILGHSGGVTRHLQAIINNRDNTFDSVYDFTNTSLGVFDYTIHATTVTTP